jgi:hypothetical protein
VLKILLVDNNQQDATILKAAFAGTHPSVELLLLSSLDSLPEWLSENVVDAILWDPPVAGA